MADEPENLTLKQLSAMRDSLDKLTIGMDARFDRIDARLDHMDEMLQLLFDVVANLNARMKVL